MRRLGQQSAVRDPAKLSVLRTRLMQAGFYNREAPVIYLGARAATLVVATDPLCGWCYGFAPALAHVRAT